MDNKKLTDIFTLRYFLLHQRQNARTDRGSKGKKSVWKCLCPHGDDRIEKWHICHTLITHWDTKNMTRNMRCCCCFSPPSLTLVDICYVDANENKSLNMEVASIYVISSDRRVSQLYSSTNTNAKLYTFVSLFVAKYQWICVVSLIPRCTASKSKHHLKTTSVTPSHYAYREMRWIVVFVVYRWIQNRFYVMMTLSSLATHSL